ncbi:MAG: transketolase [Candidatus Zambryskibacteria bacterium RIFCSPLOWO2_02_FULL_51_21]|uniref:Transketolase n=1 Tax=Candidatus Zambryskibacteria bacterium RIFCSPHIGHO2_02_FULL_43_37 TaxID=1802749 RepID=A0A1G2THH9_9BACT|nr:MAG: transketolase [Candidatus Zambryskibacteria bacterium RIFCSPHIGHO2_01_FULL_52_18]OHA96764.1 MAG: transketolase [Candidatus Zambryskibacteria bacterium RIFCSPHIGHO2_02_FULL_43_37]OHB07457.1 MAG: transketolase [Candidatus Zambryskibacteria bacterium RIFCSPLOWO2_01_FULL_52_12]OHB11120.1 MAG: transketolase [Candidatus Zambryskibacteria bacterium RIFCSPLOWO2_02_FULL_51_21]
MELSDERIKELAAKANDIRVSLIEALVNAGSGHTAGPLDMADIFTVLFFHTLKHKPKKPDWPERDRLVLSNGHICPVLYSAMAHAGYFPLEELKTLRKFGSRLQGHPHRDFLPMLETSSGPLGSGLSQAVGMAIADKMDYGLTSSRRIYALLSDGELECGQTWEAAMLAGKEKLHNLTAVVDRNNIQIDGYTENVMPLESLSDKWRAWNWHVIEIDGHNIEEIADAFEAAKSVFGQPTVIIAHTIAGKGVKEFERDYRWHGKPPSPEEGRVALHELRTLGGKIRSEHQ